MAFKYSRGVDFRLILLQIPEDDGDTSRSDHPANLDAVAVMTFLTTTPKTTEVTMFKFRQVFRRPLPMSYSCSGTPKFHSDKIGIITKLLHQSRNALIKTHFFMHWCNVSNFINHTWSVCDRINCRRSHVFNAVFYISIHLIMYFCALFSHLKVEIINNFLKPNTNMRKSNSTSQILLFSFQRSQK